MRVLDKSSSGSSRATSLAAVMLVVALALAASTPAIAAAAQAAGAGQPSRLSVDFSSTLFVSTEAAPPSVLAAVDALLADMRADGVNSLCGRHDKHLCPGDRSAGAECKFCLAPVAADAKPCSCAGRNNTRCTCAGQLTAAQFFSEAHHDLELARVLVVSRGESTSISGGINANFNSTIRLMGGSKVVVTDRVNASKTGAGDLELDNSHLDLLEGSQLILRDDADLENEDAGTMWLSGGSSIHAINASDVEARLTHTLVEGASTIAISQASTFSVSQEWDMTPAIAAAICNEPFKPDADAEYCFKNKEACKKRWPLLTHAQKSAVFMLSYPPALDSYGRQAFDYLDDMLYDDAYDYTYEEPQLEAGPCASADVCDAGSVGPPPIPAEPRGNSGGARRLMQAAPEAPEPASTTSTVPVVTQVNPPDSLDGKSYDPEFGEGPDGETLCDAPPFRAFNYYGMLVRGGSTISISGGSKWYLADQSRLFVINSTVIVQDNSTLELQNSTLVLIGSRLVLKQGSQVLVQHNSGLQLFDSRVLGDNAMFALPPNSTWAGKPWVPKGDYRASPGGSLPYFMGAQPGQQLGSYALRVNGFDLEARMLPAAGCKCKKPRVATTRVAASVTRYQ